MKKAFLIFLAVIAVTSATQYPKGFGKKLVAQLVDLSGAQPDTLVDDVPAVDDNEVFEDLTIYGANNDELPPVEDVENFGWILSHEAKKAVKNLIKQLPCGWPEAGIPPLAPYRREELVLNIKNSVVETLTTLIRFKVDGLQNMVIKKLNVSFIGKKVKYSITVPKLTISGKYVTKTLINLLNEYGISIQYDGSGDFEIILENLNVNGSFKYKIPFIFGSIKIYKFNAVVTLGGCEAHINGFMGNGKANQLINDEIEDTIMWAINGHQQEISDKIENTIVPRVNQKMKGHKIWSLIGSGGGGTSTCVPPPDPWA